MCRNTKNGKVYNTKRIDEDDRTEIDNYSNSDILTLRKKSNVHKKVVASSSCALR